MTCIEYPGHDDEGVLSNRKAKRKRPETIRDVTVEPLLDLSDIIRMSASALELDAVGFDACYFAAPTGMDAAPTLRKQDKLYEEFRSFLDKDSMCGFRGEFPHLHITSPDRIDLQCLPKLPAWIVLPSGHAGADRLTLAPNMRSPLRLNFGIDFYWRGDITEPIKTLSPRLTYGLRYIEGSTKQLQLDKDARFSGLIGLYKELAKKAVVKSEPRQVT
ncbi:MAG TPA: hypothetical protein VJ110_01450 [Candidatus Nanoarchaeia archaeon]|nr:hypothetical protein [Candidatus Nanoarchaeia archaeon]